MNTPRPLTERATEAVVDAVGYVVLQLIPPVVLAKFLRMECSRRRKRARRLGTAPRERLVKPRG